MERLARGLNKWYVGGWDGIGGSRERDRGARGGEKYQTKCVID